MAPTNPPQVVLPYFIRQSSSCLVPSIEDEQACNSVHGYAVGAPYSDPIAYEIHPAEAGSVASQSLEAAYSGSTYARPLYALSLPTYWVSPVVTQTIIPSSPVTHVAPWPPVAYVAPSFSAPATQPPQSPQQSQPPQPPQVPTDDRRSGTRTQKEEDLIQLERSIISSLWYAANALEPPCGHPDCPHLAEHYGTRGMSCYTAFIDTKPNGAFGCWREECSAYSTRRPEDALKHQRRNHFNHTPFLCVPANGPACPKRFFSPMDLHSHQGRCH